MKPITKDYFRDIETERERENCIVLDTCTCVEGKEICVPDSCDLADSERNNPLMRT